MKGSVTRPASSAVHTASRREGGTRVQHQYIRPRPRRQRIVSVDLDGTVAKIERRHEYALQFGPDGSVDFYTVLLDGSHYHMDEPIPESRDFLWSYVRELKGKIVYLSGRRQGTESHSEKWLREHGFPGGEIIHREMGHKSLWFKSDWIQTLRNEYWVDAHIGDRLDDDGNAAKYNGVKFVHIKDYKWPSKTDLFERFK